MDLKSNALDHSATYADAHIRGTVTHFQAAGYLTQRRRGGTADSVARVLRRRGDPTMEDDPTHSDAVRFGRTC